jgi:hypothetical protein
MGQLAPRKAEQRKKDTMTKKRLIMLPMCGAALVAASQAQAQNTFNNEDLLLNFRNYTTQTDPNVTVDLGNVNTFVSTVAALPGGTAVLDSGSGITPTVAAGLPTAFSYSGLTGALGAPSTGNVIGFSAAAADGTGSGLLYLTRTQTSASLTPPTHISAQQSLTAQANTALAINNIGSLTTGSPAATLTGSGVNAVSYPSANANSYQSQGQDSGNPSEIDFGGSQSTASGAGGVIESQVNGSANVYEALWEVPVKGTGSDTYEGYFTFQTDGEVDFTTAAVVAVPEPAVYGLLAGVGLMAVAMRRQVRSLSL